jgi:hypothetical protein
MDLMVDKTTTIYKQGFETSKTKERLSLILKN